MSDNIDNLMTITLGTCDSDPGQQDPVLWRPETNTHGIQKSCGEKLMAWPFSMSERGPRSPPPGQAFIVFLGTLITSRMVLIYYA